MKWVDDFWGWHGAWTWTLPFGADRMRLYSEERPAHPVLTTDMPAPQSCNPAVNPGGLEL